MQKNKISLVMIGAVAAAGLLLAPIAGAQEAQQPPAAKPAEKGQPFSGKVETVDATAKTMTVGGALIYVADTTKLSKAGKPILLADIKAGDEVHGMKRQTFDGKSEAITVRVGPEEKTPTPEPKP